MNENKKKTSFFQWYKIPVIIAGILVLVMVIYMPIFRNLITNWDDELYIIDNPYLHSLSFDSIIKIFSSYYAGNYHPLTLLSMAVGYQLGGANPWPYHLFSLLFHAGNTLLVFIFVKSLLQLNTLVSQKTNFVSLFTALLFGIHTLQVESVAWVSELKNVQYSFFFLLSLIAYIYYLYKNQQLPKSETGYSPSLRGWGKRNYYISLFFFILSLLSKGMAITLPVCLIAIDYFAKRNLLSKRTIVEKIPFFVLSIVFGIIAIYAQQSGEALNKTHHMSWINQTAIASYGFIQYIIKLLIPVNLSAYYPYPHQQGPFLTWYFYIFIVIVISLLFVVWRYYRENYITLFGTLLFIVNISIVIQILPVGNAIMADRYVYIPSVGFFLILAYYIRALWEKYIGSRTVIVVLLTAYCIFLCINTYQRIGIWRDSLTLWNDALSKYPENNDRGYQNRGNILFNAGNYSDALSDYTCLMEIDPKNDAAFIGLGRIKMISGDQLGALDDFNTAISINKTYEGYINRSVIKINLKDFDSALADADSACSLNPYKSPAFINKGYIYFLQENFPKALDYYSQAIAIDPQNSKIYFGRARIRYALNDFEGARADLDASIQLQPDALTFYYRGIVNLNLNLKDQGCADLNQAAIMGYSQANEEIEKNCK